MATSNFKGAGSIILLLLRAGMLKTLASSTPDNQGQVYRLFHFIDERPMKGNNAQSHTSHKLGDYRIDCPEQDTFANEGEQF